MNHFYIVFSKTDITNDIYNIWENIFVINNKATIQYSNVRGMMSITGLDTVHLDGVL